MAFRTLNVLKNGAPQPGFFGNPVSETQTSFTYNKVVVGAMDGTYTVQIDLTDRAGNVWTFTYNARGQRLSITYGNDTETTYTAYSPRSSAA